MITSWNEVPHTWWGPFAVWKGGLGIWGGIALGVVVGLWRVHRRGEDVAEVHGRGRAGAAGGAVDRPRRATGSTRSCSASRRACRGAWRSTPRTGPAQYANDPTFHPTFLYEIIWNLSLAAFLVWLGHHRDIRPPGLFALYVAGYSAFRIFEELLRVDPAHHFLGLRLNLFVAVTLTIVGLVWFACQPAAHGRASVRLRRLALRQAGERRVLGVELRRRPHGLVVAPRASRPRRAAARRGCRGPRA